jgi:hypothetical protein
VGELFGLLGDCLASREALCCVEIFQDCVFTVNELYL